MTILCLLFVASKFGTPLAHVAELPGKLRLDEATYKAVQAIYYPGYTLVGLVGEFGGMIALAALLYLTPYGTSRFWWTVAALVFLLAGHAIYWLMTHPVNNFWVKDVATSGPGAAYFSIFASRQTGDWTELRNIWELSHVIVFGFVTLSLGSLAVATAFGRRSGSHFALYRGREPNCAAGLPVAPVNPAENAQRQYASRAQCAAPVGLGSHQGAHLSRVYLPRYPS